MPPRWSLGYLQSSAHYYPDSTFISLAENFRNRKIPCDGLFFDTQHMDASRDFTWDKKGFSLIRRSCSATCNKRDFTPSPFLIPE